MKCFHHNDMDGKCAGAIVYKFYDGKGKYISIDYKDDFPFDTIEKDELVIIVDFSLQKDGDFDKLLEVTKNITWIDHHKSAIEKHKHISSQVKGIQRDGTAGCELTWKYYFPDVQVPDAVRLLGDFDVWAFKYGKDTDKFQMACGLYNTKPNSENWERWLDSDIPLDTELNEGDLILKYCNKQAEEFVKKWSFPTKFEGYTGIAVNRGNCSSKFFDSIAKDYDLMLSFVFDGKQFIVSVYTKKDNIDCSEIAKKYGGGGHKQASGFQCKELPFKYTSKRLVKE